MSLMAVDPGVTTGICITNNTFAGQKFDSLIDGLNSVRETNMGNGGVGRKTLMKWGEVTVTTELLPGSFVAWFQMGPFRGEDQEYWAAYLMADLVELCGVQHLAIEDFILRGNGSGGRMAGVNSGRDGLSAVRITAQLDAILRSRRLIQFYGVRGGVENRVGQRGQMRLGKKDGCMLHKQQPGSAKQAFTDDRLRRAGLWIVGHEHARDAMRHLCLLYRRTEGTKRVPGKINALERAENGGLSPTLP